MDISALGWGTFFEAHFNELNASDYAPARVVRQDRERYTVMTAGGQGAAVIPGRFRHKAVSPADFPVVGDWVAVNNRQEPFIIETLLPRRSAFTRKTAGMETEEQVLAANIDTAFLVMGLDGNFNVRRIERFLTTAWDSGASPVIILNKADLHDETTAFEDEVASVAIGVPVHAVSALDGRGLDAVREQVGDGITVALFGSSGVGKSTIINRLLGEERLYTQGVSDAAARGRHTTTHRELVILPDGGVLIDTPGLREIQLWADFDSLERSFEDIAILASGCRFRDCSHEKEPGCEVLVAVEDGRLEESRFRSFLKQRRELAFLERRQDNRARRRAEKEWGRKMSSYMKDLKKRKPNR